MEFTGERFVPETHGEIELEHLHRYLLACEVVAGKAVLDIASGEGYGSAMMARTAASVVGVDISVEAVEHANARYRKENLRFLVGSCSTIPLPDASVDIVVSFETIEHHDEHEQMMQEIQRVLRPEGVLFISSPDKQNYSVDPNFTNEFHVKELFEKEFKDLLKRYFKNSKYFGQRIVYGSGILSESDKTPAVTYKLQGPDVVRGDGLTKPVYWLAAASNGSLPDVPSGIFEESIDLLLAQKDKDWSIRVEQTARDFRREIDRIAVERDGMLVEREAAVRVRMLNLVPKVSVVIVNYNGMRFLDGLLASIKAQTLPAAEVIIVDNASTDGSIDYLAKHYPWVTVVKSHENLGFAEGNNVGVRAASSSLVALLNNDAVAEPQWLECLVESWVDQVEKGVAIGAVAPKIRFLTKFLNIEISSTTSVANDNDGRPLGIALDLNETRILECDYLKPLTQSGFHSEEKWADGRTVRWTSGEANLLLPFTSTEGSLPVLRITAARPGGLANTTVAVRCEGTLLGEFTVSADFVNVDLPLPASIQEKAFWVLNNAGSTLDELGNAADIGINQRDFGQFDDVKSLNAFCGCSLLFDRKVFLALGGFDKRFFMYYEDADLAWRMRKAGLHFAFDARAVVRHIHAGSSIEWSPGFRYHVTRNQRLIALKNAPAKAIPRLGLSLLREFLRGKKGSALNGRVVPLNEMAPAEIERKAIGDAFRMAPRILVERAFPALIRKS